TVGMATPFVRDDTSSSRGPQRDRQHQNAAARKAGKTNGRRRLQNVAFTTLQADCCRAGDDVVKSHAVADGSAKSLSGNQCKQRQAEIGSRRLLKIREKDV